MKKCGITLALWLLALVPGWGQVTVDLALEQDQFLPEEALPLKVRVTNRSGQSLRLGAEPDWLTFTIEAKDGPREIVAKTGEVPVQGEFLLESSKAAVKFVDLSPYFLLERPGRYEVVATVRIKGWDRDITSPPTPFNLIRGAKLWEQDIGVPPAPGATNTLPEVRKYVLQQANYLKGQIRLYLRITDRSGLKNFRVVPIGQMISFSRPEPQVDKASHLHLLYQSGPHTFSYLSYAPDGELLVRQTYDFMGGPRPRLRADDDGVIAVMGGTRRPMPTDLPPAKTDVPAKEGSEKPS